MGGNKVKKLIFIEHLNKTPKGLFLNHFIMPVL